MWSVTHTLICPPDLPLSLAFAVITHRQSYFQSRCLCICLSQKYLDLTETYRACKYCSLAEVINFWVSSAQCIRPHFDSKTASTITASIVHSKLDYCNCLYYNLPKSSISRLQQFQNCFARTVVKAPKSSHITLILRSLHWLKINERVEYSITCVGVSYRWYRLLASRIIEVVSAVAVAMSVLVRRRSLLILTNTCSVSRTTTGVL